MPDSIAGTHHGQENFTAEQKEILSETPRWALELCPELPPVLPQAVTEDFLLAYTQAQQDVHEAEKVGVIVTPHDTAVRALNIYMNNFWLKAFPGQRCLWETDPYAVIITQEENHASAEKLQYSKKMEGLTQHEFHAIIDTAIRQTGVDISELEEAWKEHRQTRDVNTQLLPAVIALQGQGFKRYPDLTV